MTTTLTRAELARVRRFRAGRHGELLAHLSDESLSASLERVHRARVAALLEHFANAARFTIEEASRGLAAFADAVNRATDGFRLFGERCRELGEVAARSTPCPHEKP